MPRALARPGVQLATTLAAAALVLWAIRAQPAWLERHAGTSYCAAGGPGWPWIVVRALAVAAALAIVVLLRPRLLRVAARELAITLVSSAVALALALGVVELVLRRLPEPDMIHEDVAPRPDARLGWTMTPDRSRTVTRNGRTFTYTVDAWGDRAARAGDLGRPAAPTLVIAGESVAFGHDLEWDETFGAVAGKALGLEVVNVAVPAYSTGQAYLRVLDTLPRLARPVALVFVVVPIEILRNTSPERPHFRLGPDGPRLVPAERVMRLALLGRNLYHDEEPLRVTRALLVAVAAAARARGTRPLFVLTNYGTVCPAGEDGTLAALVAGLPSVRVDLGPEDVLGPRDPHPNPRGARKIAAAVVAWLGSGD